METGEMAKIKKILEIYGGRLKELEKFGSISLEIKSEAEKNRIEAVEAIENLTNERDAIIENIKNYDISARHYESELGTENKKIIKEIKNSAESGQACSIERAWAKNLLKILTEYKIMLGRVKNTEEKSAEIIKELMAEIQQKIKNIKANRELTDKFADNYGASVGMLMNEKK